MTTKSREELPSRRAHIVRHVVFSLAGDPKGTQREMDVGCGYVPVPFPLGGRVLELFVDAGFKVGSQAQYELNDEAVMASMMLQFGMTPSGLRVRLGGGDKGLHFGADGKVIGSCCTVIQRAVEEAIDIQVELDQIYGPKAQGMAAE